MAIYIVRTPLRIGPGETLEPGENCEIKEAKQAKELLAIKAIEKPTKKPADAPPPPAGDN